jgi:glycosyltransferase involved in cell wall biosynthesis
MEQGKRLKVAICQRYLPHYRVPAFEEVHSILAQRGCDMRFYYSLLMGETAPPPWAHRLPAWTIALPIGNAGERSTAVFSPTLGWHLLHYSPDCVVLEDVSGLLNTAMAAAYCLLFRRPFLIWGLGRVPMNQPSLPRKLLGPGIDWLHRRAAGFICYSRLAQRVYAKAGRPTYLACNAMLPAPSAEAAAMVRRAMGFRAGDTLKMVSIGGLRREKRYSVLLDAVARLSGIAWELHLIGGGPDEQLLRQQAADLGVAGRVIFHGALYGDMRKKEIMIRCDVGLLPGRGGLAIQEMMSYGLPVICGVADGTESDLVLPGKTGFLIAGFPSADELAGSIRKFAGLPPEIRAGMGLAALDMALHESNAERMAQGICDAILCTLPEGRKAPNENHQDVVR